MTEFVIIGGDAAGMSAASKAKRDNPSLDVIVFERGDWVSYGACGLPYYVKGEIQSLEELVSITPEEFREERDIDVRTSHDVVAIDLDDCYVRVDADGRAFSQAFDHLLIATGAAAVSPSIDGMTLDGVYTLGSMSDGRSLRDYVASAREEGELHQPDRGPACQYLENCRGPVGIVGGGYIGIEMAEALAAHDFEVHLFQRNERLLPSFSENTSQSVLEHLREQDVVVYLDTAVGELAGGPTVEAVLTGYDRVPVDMVLVGTGVRPRTRLAEEAGIEIGPTGAIATDEYLETSAPNVYAAGDCAEVTHVVTGEPTHVPLALTANRHGRSVGRTVAGTPTQGGPVAGTAAIKTFDVEAARTGILDHEMARDAGFEPVTDTIEAKSRAGYYPEGGTIEVTLTVDAETGRILGASLVSEYGEGAVHRSHGLVAAITESTTVSQLSNYDLAYAPPFNTTWDPILTAAKVLEGQIQGT